MNKYVKHIADVEKRQKQYEKSKARYYEYHYYCILEVNDECLEDNHNDVRAYQRKLKRKWAKEDRNE